LLQTLSSRYAARASTGILTASLPQVLKSSSWPLRAIVAARFKTFSCLHHNRHLPLFGKHAATTTCNGNSLLLQQIHVLGLPAVKDDSLSPSYYNSNVFPISGYNNGRLR
jgi:hypothetical protein